MLLLSACGGSHSSTISIHTSESATAADLEPMGESESELPLLQSSHTSFWEYPALNNTTGNMFIIDAMSFNEGVAWITVAESIYAKSKHVMLIDTSGEVLYYDYTKNGDYIYTNFAQGVSLLSKNSDVLLVNTDGEVIWSQNKEGIMAIEEMYGTNSVESIQIQTHTDSNMYGFLTRYPSEFNGYFMETFKINTFEKTGTFSVVVGPDGAWLFEPISHTIFMPHDKCYYYYTDRDSEVLHGINLFTKETITAHGTMSILDSDDKIESCSDVAAKWQEDYKRSFQEGLLFDEDAKGFTDAEGNLIIDCSEYDLRHDPVFYNGYCVLMIENADGAPYITAIDSTGNRVFSPVKHLPSISDWNFYGYYSDGYITLSMESNPQFHFGTRRNGTNPCYITLDGDIIETEFTNVFPFSDGYSLACKGETYYYLNTNLKDAFPQTKSK